MQATSQGHIQLIVPLSGPHKTEQPSIQNGDTVHDKVVAVGARVVELSGGIHGEAAVQRDVQGGDPAEDTPVQGDAAVFEVCVIWQVHRGILQNGKPTLFLKLDIFYTFIIIFT